VVQEAAVTFADQDKTVESLCPGLAKDFGPSPATCVFAAHWEQRRILNLKPNAAIPCNDVAVRTPRTGNAIHYAQYELFALKAESKFGMRPQKRELASQCIILSR